MKVSQLKENIRNMVRKKLSEATIDVPNPSTETPATKKAKIDFARRTTGNKNLGTEKDPVEFIEENGEYTMARIQKMNRAELIDFLGLTSKEAIKYSTSTLRGDALELSDDKDENLEEIEDKDISRGFMPTTNLSQMSREEMLGILNLDPNTSENELTDEDLRIGLRVYNNLYSNLNEKFYLDDDDIVYEDVEDIDKANDSFEDYDKIYEGDFEPNVAPGSFYQISVKPHPTKPQLIIISQDNGQKVIVNVEDVNQLIQVLQDLM
jgi:hypothetical protein